MNSNPAVDANSAKDPAEFNAAKVGDNPYPGQIVQHEGKVYKSVKEGLAHILIPPNTPLSIDSNDPEQNSDGQSVFYNPIQQYNRDLTVLAIRAFGEEYVIRKTRQIEKQLEKKQRSQTLGPTKRGEKRKRLDGPGDGQTQTTADSQNESRPAKKPKYEIVGGKDTAPAKKRDGEQDSPTQDTLEQYMNDDDIKDEDLIECERSLSMKPNVSNPGGVNGTESTNNKTAKTTELKEPDIKVWFTILDALSATGLRALRYAQELPFATSITANDLSPTAVESIKLNVRHNGLSEPRLKVTTGNATSLMYQAAAVRDTGPSASKKLYTVVDLDPYGTAVPFLDAAVQSLIDGGLLCVTCTDTGVFNSLGYLEKCFSQYGGLPAKHEYRHEAGVRLILHSIAAAAAKYGLSIEPLLSLSIDFYARVFVKIRRSPAEVKFLCSKTMMVYACDGGCGAWTKQFMAKTTTWTSKKGAELFKHHVNLAPTASPNCEHCGFKTHLSGPMWGGPLHSPYFIRRMLDLIPSLSPQTYQTLPRIQGMLTTALEETTMFDDPTPTPAKDAQSTMPANTNEPISSGASSLAAQPLSRLPPHLPDPHPFYIFPSSLARVLHCAAPSDAQFKGALRRLGFRCVRSHAKPGSVKTDAPWNVIWRVMREWVRQRAGVKEGSVKKTMAGWRILYGNEEEPDDAGGKLGEGWEEVARGEGEIKVLRGEDGKWRVVRRVGGGKEDDEVPDGEGEKEAELNRKTGRAKEAEVVFDEKLGKDKDVMKLVRYQANPRPNWGPMTRAKKE